MISADTGHQDVHPTVIVVVATGDSHTIETDVETAPGSDIAETACAIIMVQCHGRRPPRIGRCLMIPITRIHKEQVWSSIIVVIEKRYPSAHRLGQEFVAGSAIPM